MVHHPMPSPPAEPPLVFEQVRRWIIAVLAGVLLLAVVDMAPEVHQLAMTTERVKAQTMVQALQTTTRVMDSMRTLDIAGIDGRLLEISHHLKEAGTHLTIWNTRPEKISLQKPYPTEISLQHLLEKLHREEPLALDKDRLSDIILEMEMVVRRELLGFHLADEEGGVKKILPPEVFEQRLMALNSQHTLPGDLALPAGTLTPQQLAGFWWRMEGGEMSVTTAITRSGSCLDCHPDDRSRTVYLTFTRLVGQEISRLRQKTLQDMLRNLVNFLLVATAIYVLRHRISTLVMELRDRQHALAEQNRELVINITESRRIAIALKDARDRMESAVRLKDKFITVVSHDLRSPLTVIISTLEFLKGESQDSQTQGLLDHLIMRSERMLKMVQHLLEMGKLQTGMIRPKPMAFNAHSTMAGLLHDFRLLAEKKGVALENQVPQGVRLFTDFNLFNRVIENLLSNAVKFCRAGDSITCHLVSQPAPVVIVEDTGVGIPAEVLPHLFVREKVTTSRGTLGEEGNGLGLPLCHEIAQALGGSITVESTLGTGSRFLLHLPANALYDENSGPEPGEGEEGMLVG